MTDPGWPAAGSGPAASGGPSTLPGWGPDPSASARPTSYVSVQRSPRLLDGLLVGLAAAAVGGLLWWGAVAFTERQFVYGAILVGWIVGQGVLVGSRKGGPIPALMGLASTLVALVVAEYFIQRSLAISQFGLDLELWLGWSTAVEMIETTISDDPITLLFWFVAAGVAGFAAGTSRDPVV